MKKIVIYSFLFALLFDLRQVLSDDEIIRDNTEKKIDVDKERTDTERTEDSSGDGDSVLKILQDYFTGLELTFNESDARLYSKQVLDMMKDFNKAHNLDLYSDAKSLNYQINKIIYNEQTAAHKDKYQTIIDTIKLILPEGSASTMYEDALADLLQYRKEQPELAEELLDRLDVALKGEDLCTEDLKRYYRNFYNHWIPLGRLMKFAGIEPQLETTEES